MRFTKDIHNSDLYHLNVGVPLVIGLVLLVVNLEFFALRFLENVGLVLDFYVYATFIFLIVVFLSSKKTKDKKRIVNISFYDTFVYNSLLVFIFLLANFTISKPIFEQQIVCDRTYKANLVEAQIPTEYLNIYKLDLYEYDKYFNVGYDINVRIDKSFFGYKFIKERKFIEAK